MKLPNRRLRLLNTASGAHINGADATERSIAIGNVPIGNVGEGLALDSHYVYGSNYPADSIARASLDAERVSERFIALKGVPEGIAVTNPGTGSRAADEPACPRSKAPILLGLKHFAPGPYAEGWGEVAPATISNGGASASGTVSQIHWGSWGGKAADGHGRNPIFMLQGGYYRHPAVIQLRASEVRRCTHGGPLVYTRLTAREPARPGGPLGPWFTWARNMCA